MPKIPSKKKPCPPTFLEFVIERTYGEPAYRGYDYAVWKCPFHDDNRPSFNTRPPHPQYKDRWRCWSCGAWGDELDFIKEYFPNESHAEQLERLRTLRAEYNAIRPSFTTLSRGSGSSVGMIVLRALMRAGQVEYEDLLEVVAELNCRKMLAVEFASLSRTGER